ncbi:MAG TPA: pseudouridine synthase [Myxococcaceae bacterium]|nr:pseudouridine synthase [Myxococcaceae bacterium]
MSERLQKFLARAGVASRRHAEGLITAGRVSVNNQRVTELGTKVEPTDLVTVDGRLVTAPEHTSWYLLHKPPGVVTTLSDPEGRPTVAGLLAGVEQRVFPVGRLDWDAEGALLVTNDGAAAHRLLHPSFEVPRAYLVKVKGAPTDETLARLLEGVRLEDGPARALRAERFEVTERNTWLLLQVGEGRPHLVKRLCAAVGHPVVRLFRPAQAGVSVAGLQPGELRPLTAEEVQRVEAVASGGSVPEPAPFLPPRRHGRAGEDDEPTEDTSAGTGAAGDAPRTAAAPRGRERTDHRERTRGGRPAGRAWKPQRSAAASSTRDRASGGRGAGPREHRGDPRGARGGPGGRSFGGAPAEPGRGPGTTHHRGAGPGGRGASFAGSRGGVRDRKAPRGRFGAPRGPGEDRRPARRLPSQEHEGGGRGGGFARGAGWSKARGAPGGAAPEGRRRGFAGGRAGRGGASAGVQGYGGTPSGPGRPGRGAPFERQAARGGPSAGGRGRGFGQAPGRPGRPGHGAPFERQAARGGPRTGGRGRGFGGATGGPGRPGRGAPFERQHGGFGDARGGASAGGRRGGSGGAPGFGGPGRGAGGRGRFGALPRGGGERRPRPGGPRGGGAGGRRGGRR